MTDAINEPKPDEEPPKPIECTSCGVSFDPGPTACPVCGTDVPQTHEGTVLMGKYRVGRLLGRGGMGVVHRAQRIGPNGEPAGEVAIKFLLGQWASRPELRARFTREADVLRRFQHRGIVAAEAFGELPPAQGGDLYLVMELVRGTLLSEQINVAGQVMPIERVVRLVDQVLEVLEIAHDQGIVHRDLKPENVMTIGKGDDEHVKIFDFGLALVPDHEVAKRLTETYAVHGTPFYMSPEQCRGRDVGPPTDIYAIGAMLFEMLAGAPPFEADNMATLLVQQMFVEPPRVVERGVKRPAPLAIEAIARHALSKKAEDRPNAAKMRRALQAAMAGEDDVTLSVRATDARLSAATATRADRAIAQPKTSAGPTTPPTGSVTTIEPAVRALLWGFNDARASALRMVLATHAISADVCATSALVVPPGVLFAVLLIAGGPEATARTEQCKASPSLNKMPIFVVDHARADDLTKLIRAGASDVAMEGVADDVLVQKVRRLVKRRR